MEKLQQIGFFMPVVHDYQADTILGSVAHFVEDNIDAYFALHGRRAFIISPKKAASGENLVHFGQEEHCLFRRVIVSALKVATWATIIIPAILLLGKLIFRCANGCYPYKSQYEVTKGDLNARDDYYSKLIAEQLPPLMHQSNKEIKKDVIGFLTDKAVNAMQTLVQPPLKDKAGGDVKEIAGQFYADCNRLDKLIINHDEISDVGIIKKDVQILDEIDHKRRLITQAMLKSVEKPLVQKLTAWIHQGIHAQATTLVKPLLEKYGDSEKGLFLYPTQSGGYTFDVKTTETHVQLEATLIIKMVDMLPQIQGGFDTKNYTKKDGLGYFGIYKRIYVPKQDLIDFDPKKGLKGLKVEQIITPVFETDLEAQKALNYNVLQLKPNFSC